MFDIAAETIAWIPIKWGGIRQPEGEGAVAEAVEYEVECLIVVLSRDELIDVFPEDFGDELDAETPPEARAVRRTKELDRFKRVCRDWRKIVNKGTPVPFTDPNIRLALGKVGFGSAFKLAYYDACGGKVATRTGNSNASPAGGQAGEA